MWGFAAGAGHGELDGGGGGGVIVVFNYSISQ